MFRLAIPLLYMFGPRLLPPIIRFLRLVWRLTFDKRVPLILRALVPLAILYALSPKSIIPNFVPVIGRFDDLFFLGLAALLLTKLAPKHVLDEISGGALKKKLGLAVTSERVGDRGRVYRIAGSR